MDHVIVFAARQFLGFELCKQLLDKGYEVTAIDHCEWQQTAHEEKWLSIGRNANLQYFEMGKQPELKVENTIAIIPIYDYFINENDKIIKKYLRHYGAFFQNKKIEKICTLEPLHFFEKNYVEGKGAESIKIRQLLLDNEQKRTHYYLPTIFGPWQPDSLLFQQIISQNKKKLADQVFLDHTDDAIFIETAIQSIITHMESNELVKEIVLTSDKNDVWRKHVQLLDEHFCLPKHFDTYPSVEAEKLRVTEHMSYAENLAKQKIWWEKYS